MHLVVILFRQSFYSEGRCLFSFILWKTNYLDINFLIYWRYSLETAWQKKGLPKSLCKKESSRKNDQNYYLLLEGLQEKNTLIFPQFSVNLFLIDLHQTSKEIQSSAAKEGFGKLSNCSTFGAFPHYPLKQHLVNFFF